MVTNFTTFQCLINYTLSYSKQVIKEFIVESNTNAETIKKVF